MKLNKKKVVVSAVAVSLVAILSMGTLAWFSASDEVNNKFMIADSESAGDADKIFSVDVWENVDTNEDGTKEKVGVGADTDNTTEATYKDILPGAKYVKEPHVENTGYYDQYIRVIITISDANAWVSAMGEDYDITKCFDGFVPGNWGEITKTIDKGAGTTDTIQYVLYYNGILEKGGEITLFNKVVIPEELTQAQAAEFGTDFTLDVKAQAVQTGGNVAPVDTDGNPQATASAAKAAFTKVGMAISE